MSCRGNSTRSHHRNNTTPRSVFQTVAELLQPYRSRAWSDSGCSFVIHVRRRCSVTFLCVTTFGTLKWLLFSSRCDRLLQPLTAQNWGISLAFSCRPKKKKKTSCFPVCSRDVPRDVTCGPTVFTLWDFYVIDRHYRANIWEQDPICTKKIIVSLAGLATE